MKKLLFSVFLMFFTLISWAQNTPELRGKVLNAKSQEPIENAMISIFNTNLSTATNVNGEFVIVNPTPGKQFVTITYTGFGTKTLPVEIDENGLDLGVVFLEEDQTSEMQLSLITLTENDLGDDNTGSETTSGLLQSSRDPFEQIAAFNWGQARFRIRSLDNEYGNTFINGVSMNKLFDGRPQYSNWGGLNDVTRSQEFNSSSRPSDYTFGGILGTQAINSRASMVRPGTRLSFSGANTNYNWRALATYGSGMNANGWSYAASASYRLAQEGHFEGTDYDAKSFFLAIEKRINDAHNINLSGFYAQNSRGKNSPNTQEVVDLMGFKYNSFWGFQDGKKRNSRDKDVEEPLFILSHDWKITGNSKLNTNISYQFGTISNSRLDFAGGNNPDPTYYKNLPSYYLNLHNIDGSVPYWTPDYANAENAKNYFLQNAQINWERMYHANRINGRAIYALYADVMNDKQITANTLYSTQLTQRIGFNGGITYRNLKSENYQEMLDLLGDNPLVDYDPFFLGDFGQSDLNNPNRKINVGDKYGYNYIINAEVIDAFTQFKFNLKRVDIYFAQNYSMTKYQRDGLYKNGLYAENSYGKSETASFNNWGLKGGALYRIKGNHLVDFNAAYYTKAPAIRNTFANARLNNNIIDNLDNETVYGLDLNYIVRMPKLKGRIGGYYNQITDATELAFFYADGIDVDVADVTSEFVSEITQNVDKRSMGLELGLEYQATPTIKLIGGMNLGQAYYSDNADVTLNVDGRSELGLDPRVDLGTSYIKNYRIAGAPQKAYSLGIEYRDPKYWWIGANVNYLSDLYLDVSSIMRTNNFFAEPGQNGAAYADIDTNVAKNLLRQERLDDIFLVNIQGGKSWKIGQKTLGFFASVNNVLGLEYKTGGFEQARNANYRELLMDHASGTRTFGPRYFYGYGRTYFVNFYINL